MWVVAVQVYLQYRRYKLQGGTGYADVIMCTDSRWNSESILPRDGVGSTVVGTSRSRRRDRKYVYNEERCDLEVISLQEMR